MLPAKNSKQTVIASMKCVNKYMIWCYLKFFFKKKQTFILRIWHNLAPRLADLLPQTVHRTQNNRCFIVSAPNCSLFYLLPQTVHRTQNNRCFVVAARLLLLACLDQLCSQSCPFIGGWTTLVRTGCFSL